MRVHLRIAAVFSFIIATVVLAGGETSASSDRFLELPYRSHPIEIDGDFSDWNGSQLKASFDETELGAPRANSCTARSVWDRDHLYFAFEVDDAEVFVPPITVKDRRLTTWDSIEIYIDSGANGGMRMGPGDFQIVCSCDGRTAVLRGDPVLATIDALAVPKSEIQTIPVDAAAIMTTSGYRVECAIPWPALGVRAPHAGQKIGLDLAMNDWVEDHPLMPEVVWDLKTFEVLREDLGDANMSLLPGDLSWADRLIIEDRAYFPLSWSGTRDFGYPNEWFRVRLVGQPPILERVLERWGIGGLLIGVAGACLVPAMILGIWFQRRTRQRIQALMLRLEALEPQLLVESTSPQVSEHTLESEVEGRIVEDIKDTDAPSPKDALSGNTDVINVLISRPDAQTTLAERAVIQVHHSLEGGVAALDLANELNVSLRTLERELKGSLDCSPRELIQAIRMREAHRLLTAGTHNVSEVASYLGFSSPSHFSTQFKKHFNFPPSTLIKDRKSSFRRS